MGERGVLVRKIGVFISCSGRGRDDGMELLLPPVMDTDLFMEVRGFLREKQISFSRQGGDDVAELLLLLVMPTDLSMELWAP